MRCVIGDDSMPYRDRFKRLAREAGHEVVGIANNAEATLKLCEELKPDLAIVDVIMPPGDGQTVALELVKRKIVKHVVVATNNSQESRWKMFHDVGIITFTKPGHDDQFLAKLRSIHEDVPL